MSKKNELRKAILKSEKDIEELERKLFRSQTALLDALLTNAAPEESDMEYFHIYKQLIEVERKNLRILKDKLEELA